MECYRASAHWEALAARLQLIIQTLIFDVFLWGAYEYFKLRLATEACYSIADNLQPIMDCDDIIAQLVEASKDEPGFNPAVL